MIPPTLRHEFEICPALLEMLESGKTMDATGTEHSIHSTSTLNNLLTIRRLFESVRPSSTLEIGLGFGASCALFAALHKNQGATGTGQHIGIDPLQETLWKNTTPSLLKRAELENYTRLLTRSSALELPTLVQESCKFDLIYIDGSHLFEDVFVDFYFSRLLLSLNGIIAFDDCAMTHVAKVLAFIRSNLSASFEEIDLSSFRADKGKSLKYRIARILGKTQMRAFRLIGDCERPQFSPLGNF